MALELEGTDRDLVDIAASYQRPGGAFRVLADASGNIAGCGGLYPQREREAEIRKMYLIPAMRGKGLGLTLLRNLVDIARAKGVERITLETKTVLREAIAMYQRFGFREIHLEHRTPRCDRAFELILAAEADE